MDHGKFEIGGQPVQNLVPKSQSQCFNGPLSVDAKKLYLLLYFIIGNKDVLFFLFNFRKKYLAKTSL